MDGERFDRLTKGLAGQFASRRRLVGAAVGAALLGGLGLRPEGAAAKDCGRNKKKCGHHCCSEHETCKHGKCLKKCDRKEQRCGDRCIKKCKHSNSDCCFGKFPTCCPKGTFTNDFCCSKNRPVCCPPSPEFPEFPEGYCCPKGEVCDELEGCLQTMIVAGQASAGPSAPGRGGRGSG